MICFRIYLSGCNRYIILTCFALLLAPALLYGKDIGSCEGQVINLYQQGKYKEALSVARPIYKDFKKELGLENEKTLDCGISLAVLHRSLGNYSEAESLFKTLINASEKKYGCKHKKTAFYYNQFGILLQEQGYFDKAYKLYEQALAVYNLTLPPDHPSLANVHNSLAALSTSKGLYEKARSHYAHAVEITEKNRGKNHLEVALILTNQSTLLYNLEDFTQAEVALTRSLKILEENVGADHPDIAHTLDNLFELYLKTGEYDKAEEVLKRTLKIRELKLGHNHPLVAKAIEGLGKLYYRTGYFQLAEEKYKHALSIREKALGSMHPDIATNLNNLAVLYSEQGFYEKSKQLYERSLAIIQNTYGVNHGIMASSLHNFAIFQYNLGNFDLANENFARSIQLKEKIYSPDTLALAQSYNSYGVFLYYMHKDYDKAENLLLHSLKIRKQELGFKHFKTKATIENLAFLYLETGREKKSFELFTQANSNRGLAKYYLHTKKYSKALDKFLISVKNSKKRKSFFIADLIGIGHAYEGQNNDKNAILYYQKAISEIEEQWHELTVIDRNHFLGGFVGAGFKRLDAYEGIIRVLYKQKTKKAAEQALWYAERVKSRNLHEMLAQKSLGKTDGFLSELIAQTHEKQNRLRAVQQQLQKTKNLGDKVSIALREKIERQYTAIWKEYHDFLERIKEVDFEHYSLIAPVTKGSTSRIQSLLDSSTTIIEFFTTKSGVYSWVITKNDIYMSYIDISNSIVDDIINDLVLPSFSNENRGLTEPVSLPFNGEPNRISNDEIEESIKKSTKGAKKLFSVLVKPILSRLRTKNIIVVPHGAIHKVPFSALCNEEEYLIEKFAVASVPSCNVLQYLNAKRNQDNGKLIVFANPTTSHESLNFAQQEAVNIARLFEVSKVLPGDTATESRFKELTPGSDVVHFAGHGQFDPKNPMDSALLLAADSKNDGALEVDEVFGLDLRGCNLVTLSACQTASVDIQGGDELIGLSRGFIFAGTPSILATLWKVDDKSTAKLITTFYRKWRTEKLSKVEALRQAKLSLKSDARYAHPYYWAPFILIGDSQ